MSKVLRGEKLLNRLVGENRLTPTGRDWLIASLDPFHDTQLSNLEGWPDVECGASVVRCVKQSFNVAVPSTVAAGANWDAHVVAWPALVQTTLTPTSNRTGQVFLGQVLPFVATSGLVGGVQVFGMPANTNLSILQPLGSGVAEIGKSTLPAAYSKGSGRLIGMGFEVHNTTAELYKQGSLCVYRQMADARDPMTLVGGNTAGVAYNQIFSAQMVRYPPASPAEAMLISGSRQWTAEEGCYVVMAFSSEENPANPIPTGAMVVYAANDDDEDGIINLDPLNVPLPRIPTAGTTQSPVTNVRVHPIHQSGAILSGLSYSTTLTINVNYYYESFPSGSSPEILVLAKPSCKYDPCALELYSRVIQELPVGVPVCENGLGDWFLDAASKAAKFIGPALSALPHPIAKGAGAALSYLGDTGQDYVKRQNYTGNVPQNSWEQSGGGGMVSKSEANHAVSQAKKKQKAKDKKKIIKAKSMAQPKKK
jgi:hypothetical protein